MAASNRGSLKPASIASISGPQDEIGTHLGMLPSSPNILVLPAVNIPSRFNPNSPVSPSGDYPKIDVRDLVSSAYAEYTERQLLADGFVINHPSRGVILQKGWITLLAECAQLLLDVHAYDTVEEAVAAIKAVCEGGVEEIETEEEVELEIDISDTDTDKTPVIEEEPDLEAEYDDGPLKPGPVSRLSRSSSLTSNSSTSARSKFRNSDRSLSSAATRVDNSIDEELEMEEDKMVPLRMSKSTIDLQLPRSQSQASMRENTTTPPPTAGSPAPNGPPKRRSGNNGRDGKRFPVRAASMDNLTGLVALGIVNGETKNAPANSETKPAIREGATVAERKRMLEEKMAEEKTGLSSKRNSEPPEPLNLKDRSVEKWKPQFQHARSASQKLSRESLLASTNSPRVSAQSFESRSSTPTRWSEEIPKKKTKKVTEIRKVKTVKTHPPLKFQEDVMLLLHDAETSPTFIKLVDAISLSINSIPSTPFSPSFPSPPTAYPSPPISPTTPTIVVEQAVADKRMSMSSIHSTPRLSLFPRPRTRDSDRESASDPAAELLKTRPKPPIKEILPVSTPKPVTPVKKIDVCEESPLTIQNEIRGILGDRMTAVRKFPTVVQGLALGMGLGLGLLNYGGETIGNKFWSPVLGGSGVGASVDMIYAIGFERGCERWGNRLVQRLTSGVGRCGPAHCVSLNYLLSLSLRQLNPSAPNYTSQVHAALSGKYLVPQLEDYLSVNSNTRCLIITFDAATVPNTNLEPLRELRRVLDGAKSESAFKIISVIGGPVSGVDESHLTLKEVTSIESKRSSRASQLSQSRSSHRHSLIPTKASPDKGSQYSGRTGSSRATSPVERTMSMKTSSSIASLVVDEKTLMRRRELEAMSNILIIQKLDDNEAFEGHIGRIAEHLREREDRTGSFKAFESTFETKPEPEEPEEPTPSMETNFLADDDEEEEEDDDDDFEVNYNNVVMTVGVPRSQKTHSSTWSKMWSREILGKKKTKPTGPSHCGPQEQVQGSAKAFKLLGLE
ncbi:hypothetical protein Dda_7959 [Drechslerella dactyloides]|uniref:Uncharacterized protein n=1 Tax=Drechslerella dactyloides TaxID=74499 RepID=A0AAD6ISD7_DREDA|nr:hypothetical protein Dda_7959 [Drechslerella dactyloides]